MSIKSCLLILIMVLGWTGGYAQSTTDLFESETPAPSDNDLKKGIELLMLGKEHESKGSYVPAIYAFQEAIGLAERTTNKTLKAEALYHLSNINFRIANYEKALEQSLAASEVFDQLADTMQLIVANMMTAQVYIGMGKYEDSKQLYNKMLSLSRHVGDSILVADNLDHIGVCNTFLLNYEAALWYHFEAARIFNSQGDEKREGISYANIGEIYMFKREHDLAVKMLNKAYALLDKNNFYSPLIFTTYTMGTNYSLMGERRMADAYFKKSIQLADRLGEYREKPVIMLRMSEHYERTNDVKNALKYHKWHLRLKDSLQSTVTRLKIEELKAFYEMDKKEREIKVLEQESQYQRDELSATTEKMQLQNSMLTLAGISLFIVIAFLLYAVYNHSKLKTLVRTRDKLFSIIGHDLKGPIGTVKQFVDLKQRGLLEEDKLVEMIDSPLRNSMLLLDDLLVWGRNMNNQVIHKPVLLNAAEKTHEVVALLQTTANLKSISLLVELGKTDLVFADENQFLTIMRNLIANAIKFTPIDGQVRVYSRIKNVDFIEFKVADNGIGISPDKVRQMNKRQFLASTRGTSNELGSGLGLVLVNEFVKKNGGSLHVSSMVGQGSIFSFTLPRHK